MAAPSQTEYVQGLAAVIEALASASGWTQGELAQRAGLNRTTLSEALSTERFGPGVGDKVAKAFGRTWEELRALRVVLMPQEVPGILAAGPDLVVHGGPGTTVVLEMKAAPTRAERRRQQPPALGSAAVVREPTPGPLRVPTQPGVRAVVRDAQQRLARFAEVYAADLLRAVADDLAPANGEDPLSAPAADGAGGSRPPKLRPATPAERDEALALADAAAAAVGTPALGAERPDETPDEGGGGPTPEAPPAGAGRRRRAGGGSR